MVNNYEVIYQFTGSRHCALHWSFVLFPWQSFDIGSIIRHCKETEAQRDWGLARSGICTRNPGFRACGLTHSPRYLLPRARRHEGIPACCQAGDPFSAGSWHISGLLHPKGTFIAYEELLKTPMAMPSSQDSEYLYLGMIWALEVL